MIISYGSYRDAPDDFEWGRKIRVTFYRDGQRDFTAWVHKIPRYNVVLLPSFADGETAEELRDPDKVYSPALDPVAVYRLAFDDRRGEWMYIRDSLASVEGCWEAVHD